MLGAIVEDERPLKYITEGDGDPSLSCGKLMRLWVERGELTQKFEVAAPPKLALHPNVPELYRRKVTQLQSLLTDEQPYAEAHEVIRSLTKRWRQHYNMIRPNSSLGYRPPAPEAVLPRPAVQAYAILPPARQDMNPRQTLSWAKGHRVGAGQALLMLYLRLTA